MHKNNFAEHAGKRAQIICFGDRNGSSTKVTEYVTNKEIENEIYTTSSTGTTPGACARARDRSDFSEALENLGEYYCDTFDRTRVARIVQQDMLTALEAGVAPEVIMLAMDDTARAEKPTWAYTLAILKRCIRENVHTAEDWNRQKDKHSAGRLRGAARNAPKNPALNYSQRELPNDWMFDAALELYAELEKQNTK